MHILLCGDRNWINHAVIRNELLKYDPTQDVIVHGGARGADTIAGEEAFKLGFKVEAVPADWKQYGKAAGPIRNSLMITKFPVELVIAFHNNISNSKGTRNMVSQAQKKNIRVQIITEDEST